MAISNMGNFCTACGNKLIDTAVICPKCGSPTSRFGLAATQPTPPVRPQPILKATPKSKTTAVVLSVLFGPWSYLYTYKKDVGAFWISFFTPLGILMFLLYASSSGITGWQISVVVASAFILALIAIIRQATRTQDWFATYPYNQSPRD